MGTQQLELRKALAFRCATFVVMSVCLFALTATARADWKLGDPYKMHYPQLPDPNGWDVDITTDRVYDDWKCSETGPVKDVHFWISWENDAVDQITQVDMEIWDDVPATANDPSHPGTKLWSTSFSTTQFVVGPQLSGPGQGWITPDTGQSIKPNHDTYYQINIADINTPFVQQQGTIYWLGLHIHPATTLLAGWKTSLDHFNDDAAYYYSGAWHELIDPVGGASLDMAFVITPEPAALALLVLGGTVMLIRRRA